jgi:hypothetical protein
METASIQDASYLYNYVFIAIQVILLIVIISVGFYLIKRRQRMLDNETPFRGLSVVSGKNIQDMLNHAKSANPMSLSNINLGRGDFNLEEELRVNSPVRIAGISSNDTRIKAKNNRPVMRIQDVKTCTVTHVTIEGKIECSNSQLQLENCEIIANDDGICIDAQDGSTVTVSGMIRGEGGIAIRARGESKVILKQPYIISDDDYVVMEPKSSVTFQDKEQKSKPSNTPET